MFKTSSKRLATLITAVGVSALVLGCAGDTADDKAATTPRATTAATTAATPASKTAATPAATTPAAKTTGTPATSAAPAAGKIAAELAEWSVKAAAPARAGEVEFDVQNKGAAPHEFVVFKTDADPAALTKDATARVDETKYPPVGRTKQLNGGAGESLKVNLTAGKYVLVCNLSGHYDLGMRTAFTVN